MSSTSTLSQSPAVFPQRFPQRSVCHMTICCALLRSLVHFDVDKRGRRAYNTWDEGRKKSFKRKPTPAKRPQSDPQQRVLPEDNSRAGSKRDWATSSFLRPKPHPNQPGWAGGFKKRVPTTLQQGRTIDNYAVDAQQRPDR